MSEFSWDDAVGEPQSTANREPRGAFTASFDSECPECFDLIEEGDRAVMRGGAALCMECAEVGWGGRR